MENIKEQFARLFMELDLTDDQAAMIKKLQRDVDAALRQPPVSGSASPKLKHIVIIGKFDDGKCRQVLINPQTQDVVLSAVIACERQIRVLETIIEGIDIGLPS